MTKQERIRAARDAANEAAQALIDFDRKKAEAEAAARIAAKKALALHKRAATVLVNYSHEVVRQPITQTGLGWGADEDAKKLRAALEAGTQKVTGNGGQNYSVKGLAAKMRLPSALNLKAIDAALRAEKRANERWSRARQARIELEKVAWSAGGKVTPDVLIDAVVARAKVRANLPTLRGAGRRRRGPR